MKEAGFRERLLQELESRRKKNARYSLRAFATFLGSDHSTLSQVLKGTRPVPSRRIRSWAKKLGCGDEEIIVYIAAEHVPPRQVAKRQEQLRHWTAEALAVVRDRVHWQILRLSREKEFRADSRWIASETGSTIDEVNMALSRLLRLRLIDMNSTGRWKDLTGLSRLTEAGFRKVALARVREKIKP